MGHTTQGGLGPTQGVVGRPQGVLGRTRRRQYLANRRFERILLIKPSSLGDIIHALPVLHALRAHYQQARIDWLVASPFVPLLEAHDKIDNVIPFDRQGYSRVGRSLKVTARFMRFVRELRSHRYDLVLDLQGLFRTGFLARAVGHRAVRVGFRSAREGAAIFYTDKVATPDSEMHAVDRYLSVAEYLGIAEDPGAGVAPATQPARVEFNLALSDGDRADASRLLCEGANAFCETGADYVESFVAVVPGARWETKRWPAERFAETIDTLAKDSAIRCVLLGGPDEVELCNRVASASASRPINLAGATTLRQFAAIIAKALCVLCQDSAASHLAVALNRPLVCLVGPTNPRRTGPYGRLNDVLRLDIDCAPCYIRRLKRCPHDHRCMSELAVSKVVRAVNDALRSSAETRVADEIGGSLDPSPVQSADKDRSGR